MTGYPGMTNRKAVKRGLAAVLIAVAGAMSTASAADLEWLAGRWCGLNDGVFNEETWMPPRGGALVGMHRDTRDGSLAGIEFLSIVQREGQWTYLAQPSGRPPVAFTATQVTPDRVEFANPRHDFPKRIVYQRLEGDRLQASIDGGGEQGPRMQWTWTRDCGDP